MSEEIKETTSKDLEAFMETNDVAIDRETKEFSMKIKDLKALDVKTLRQILESMEFAFCAEARDDDPDLKDMEKLRLHMKRIHYVIRKKLEAAADIDNLNYRRIIKAAKKKDQETLENLIKEIL